MNYGDDYVYKCPKCNNLLKNHSLLSGNTFGSTLYSDGKTIAPMLPKFPNLTKCIKCDTILWLSEMEVLGFCNAWDENLDKEWNNAEYVDFLDISDLVRFLELDTVQNNREKELIVRQEIWWTFNDRVRAGKKIFAKETDELLWKQNCQRFLELLDTTDINERVMAAELYRNLGEFDKCMEILSTLGNEFDWIVEKFKIECEKHNTLLIIL